jgi:hypothetical protein
MRENLTKPIVGLAENYLADKHSRANYLMLKARVVLFGCEPGHSSYVGVDFVSPPKGAPLGVSTTWNPEGVELARFAMAHGKHLIIVYRQTGFTWDDIVDLCVVDY